MNKEFKKYTSIENHYRERYIDRFTSKFPDMIDEEYIATEKIHGANFSIHIFDEGNEVVFGKRTSLLMPEDSFMNHQAVMNQDDELELIRDLKLYCKNQKVSVMRVYGELFGQGVQKFNYLKVKTPTNKSFRIFDIEIEDKTLLPIEALNLLRGIDMHKMYVPIVEVTDTLQKALDINTKFRSVFSSDDCEYNCEGVVIRPYSRQPECFYEDNKETQNFMLKKKNEHFSDKAKADKNIKVFEMSEIGNKLLQEYKSYYTMARMESVFSKEGNITNSSQFGIYIKLMSEDVKEDFFKDYLEDFKLLDDKEKKSIFKVSGQLTVDLLKKCL